MSVSSDMFLYVVDIFIFITKLYYYERRRSAAALLSRLFGNSIPGHTKRAPLMQTQPAVRVGFELATNYIQFYAFTN